MVLVVLMVVVVVVVVVLVVVHNLCAIRKLLQLPHMRSSFWSSRCSTVQSNHCPKYQPCVVGLPAVCPTCDRVACSVTVST